MTLDDLAAQVRGHSVFAPSSSATWLNCPGSLVAAALAPNDGNVYAAEGTVAHDVADKWLRSGERPAYLIGTTRTVDGFEVEITAGMLAYVQQYVEVCEATPGEHRYETRVTAPDGLYPIAGQAGTADFCALSWQMLRIKDLKYGQGIKVFAERNPQAMLYAYYVFAEWDWLYDFQTIEIEICQPRLDHFDKWECSRDELLAFADTVRVAGLRAWSTDSPRTPTPKACEGCNRFVRKDCPAIATWLEQQADDVFSDVGAASLSSLGLEAAALALPMRKAVEKWFADLEERLFAQCYEHGPSHGYKVVEGRANRQWADERVAERRMREVGVRLPFNYSLKSPNQAAEQLHADTGMSKKKASGLFETIVERKRGALSLVTDDDKREAITNGVDFDAMIGE